MSDVLVNALAQMNLEPGRTYRYEVQGKQIEVRVLDELPRELVPAPLVESDIMLDAWTELPPPTGGIRLVARPGKLPPPDPPYIPQDEEWK